MPACIGMLIPSKHSRVRQDSQPKPGDARGRSQGNARNTVFWRWHQQAPK